MLKNILKVGLLTGLSIISLNAETFNKGDSVIVEKGAIICMSTESLYALDGLDRTESSFDLYRTFSTPNQHQPFSYRLSLKN